MYDSKGARRYETQDDFGNRDDYRAVRERMSMADGRVGYQGNEEWDPRIDRRFQGGPIPYRPAEGMYPPDPRAPFDPQGGFYPGGYGYPQEEPGYIDRNNAYDRQFDQGMRQGTPQGKGQSEDRSKSQDQQPKQEPEQNRQQQMQQEPRQMQGANVAQMQQDPRRMQGANVAQMQQDPRHMQGANVAQMQQDPRRMQGANVQQMQQDPRQMQQQNPQRVQQDPRQMPQQNTQQMRQAPGMMQGQPGMQQPYGYYQEPAAQNPQTYEGGAEPENAKREEPGRQQIRDEAFMEQLDTFKDKAKQLQGIINEKQDRVDYLEERLDALTAENHQLQNELEHDRQQTGDYAVDIEGQVNRLSEILGQNISEMEERIADRISEIPAPQTGEMQEITIDTEALSDSLTEHLNSQSAKLNEHLDNQSDRMEKTFAAISDKLEAIIEKQQEVIHETIDGNNEKLDSILQNQSAFSKLDRLEKLDSLEKLESLDKLDDIYSGQQKLLAVKPAADPTAKMTKIFEDQKSFISSTMMNQEKKLTNSIEGVNRELDGVKEALSEKIHAEDVKVYRNLQDFIKEQDHSEDVEKLMLTYYKKLRLRDYIIMGLVVITILLSVFFIYIIM